MSTVLFPVWGDVTDRKAGIQTKGSNSMAHVLNHCNEQPSPTLFFKKKFVTLFTGEADDFWLLFWSSWLLPLDTMVPIFFPIVVIVELCSLDYTSVVPRLHGLTQDSKILRWIVSIKVALNYNNLLNKLKFYWIEN